MMKQLKDCKTYPDRCFRQFELYNPFHCVKSKDNPFVLRTNLYTAYSLIFATVVRTVNKGSLNVFLLF